MKVSVLCTAYNHEKYIRDALDSFLNQKTNFSYEILVTDDASTDETTAIIQSYVEKYPDKIRFFHQAKNLFSQGVNLFTEILFKEARGDYLAWCEGDDYWCDSSKLQRQVDFLDAHPEYSGSVHNSLVHYCEGNRPDELYVPTSCDHDIGFETVIQGMSKSFHTSSIVVRNFVINPPPDFYHAAFRYGFTDYAIALQMALRGKIRFIDLPMSVYRRVSNAEAWSSGYHHNYGKLIRFVEGEIAMMNALLPHLREENERQARSELLKREYELLYLRGDVDKLVKPPYSGLFALEPLSFKVKTYLKLCFPALHRLYRSRQGYGD